jgi:hypothetical protein
VRALLLAGIAVAFAVGAQKAAAGSGRLPLLREELRLLPDAYVRARPLLMTLGGPVYCGQLFELAAYIDASVVCADYGRNGETSGLTRSKRVEDWGDPAYLAAAARLPGRLKAQGVKFSELVLIGASYAGYANTELVATHPELRPRALVVVDSFLDLPERYAALRSGAQTALEMVRVLGGTLSQRAAVYAARSPSHHLAGLAAAIRAGTRFVDIWSTGAAEKREFNGATCSPAANANWLSALALVLHRPVSGYVTPLRHADALRNWWREVLALAGLDRPYRRFPARTLTFRPDAPIPSASYCH